MAADAVGDGGVDGVFGDVAFDAEIVVVAALFGQLAALLFHFVGGLPGADDHFGHAPHGLRVGTHYGKHAHVVQNVFGGDGFGADARIGEGHVFGHAFVEVVAHHQHVEVFGDGVDGKRAGGVGGGGQHVGIHGGLDDVGCVAAARAFGVEGVDDAAVNRLHGVFEKTAFVEGVGVDGDLDVHFVGHGQGGIDHGGGGAPVFVDFQTQGSGADLFAQRFGVGAVALAEKAEVHRKGFGGLQHAAHIPRAGGNGGGVGAVGWAGAAADHGGDAALNRVGNLLRADIVDMGVDAAGGGDQVCAVVHFGGRADDHIGGNAVHGVGVARLADADDAAVADADVGFHDAPMVDDDHIGNHEIQHVFIAAAGIGRLCHAVAHRFAAAEFAFVAVGEQVALDFGKELRIAQADFVAHGRAVGGKVLRTRNIERGIFEAV